MTRTLLVVDDIKSNREILKNMLAGDYRIIEAEDGQDALEVMNSEYQNISAVLLDLGMPVMDGYEVLSHMSGSENLSHLPVIVTTGLTDAGSEERALSLGAKDYISKPYKSAIIKQRIRNTIVLRETAATVNALMRDRLTGLYSRDAFFEKVTEMVAKHEKGYYTAAFFDVDKFKVINDQYGTAKGDEVLRHIAGVFEEGFDKIGGLCCRVSSDDFAVIYPTVFQESEELAQMRASAGRVPGLASTLGFSIGRYVINDTALTPSAMYDRAIIAAESIKGRYDAKIALYNESMRDALLHEQEIVTEMAAALGSRSFEVWYQPQYNHATGAIVGAEALVRWRHPKKGMIPPGVFIGVFEKNGFIYELDKYVWEEACRFLRGEMDAGRHPLPVSVNISRYDMFNEDFTDSVTGLIEKYSIPVELLRLEVTESAFAESTKHIADIVKKLVNFGFTLEIDDFGSGYSSLNTLKSVPAQVVKLDMRFLEEDDSQRGGNIIESVVRMAKWLGMSVIAEGVERKAQADYLKSIGCSYVQGYLYARPMQEDEYRKLCGSSDKEGKLLGIETVENLDNDSFWSPESIDTLIFNSYVGAACIFEYHNEEIELIRATDKFAHVIGSGEMTVEDALSLDWCEHLENTSRNKITADLNESARTKKEVTGEYGFIALPGSSQEVYLRLIMRVIASVGGRHLVYCIAENITAQRSAEQRERKTAEQLKAIMDNVACGITAVSMHEDEIIYLLANDKYYELLGSTRAAHEKRAGNLGLSTVAEEDRERVLKTARQVMDTGISNTMDYRAVREDGSVIWMRSYVSMATFEGVEGKIQLSTYTDITEQKLAELKLCDTTQQLRAMMNDIPGGFCRIRILRDGSMEPVYINEGLCKLMGMSRDAIETAYRKDIMAGVHPDDVAALSEAISRMTEYGEARSSRYRLLHEGGGYVWLSIFGRVTKNERGDCYLNIYYSDATKQVQAEEQQKELLDNLPYGAALYRYDGDGLHVVHLNRRYWELVERQETECTGSDLLKAILPDDRDVMWRELKSAIREDRDVSCKIRIRCGESGYKPFHIAGRLQKNAGEYSIYAAYTPISNEEMSVQEMLLIALSAVMESRTDYSFVKDKSLRYVCSSHALAKLTRFSTPEQMAGKSDYEIFDKEIADKFHEDDVHILESGESQINSTDRLPDAGGTVRYACISKFPLKDSQGNIVGIYAVGYDITDLKAMKSQFELLTGSVAGGIASYEHDGEKLSITHFSDGFCKLFDKTRAEYTQLSRDNVFAGVFQEDIPQLCARLDSLVKDGAPVDCVFRVNSKDGGYKWLNFRASAMQRDGEKKGFDAVLFDVTQRQEAVEKLRISEEENRLAMQHTRNAVCRYEVATGRLRIPKLAQERIALPEIVENVPYGMVEKGEVSPETAKAYIEFYENIRRGSKSGAATFSRRLNSSWRWIQAQYSTIFSDTGKPVSAVISFSDITEQLEKDYAYKRWRQSFLGKAPESYSLFRCSLGSKTKNIAREGLLITADFGAGEYTLDEYTAAYVEQCVFEDDKDSVLSFLNSDSLLAGYYGGKRTAAIQYREKLQHGEVRWQQATVDLVEHTHVGDVEAYLLFEDIDSAKRLELATIEQAETDPLTGVLNRATFAARVDSLVRASQAGAKHALMMLDVDGFKLVNDAFGHGAGDQSLIEIAESLKTALRHGDLIGRLGGDEFVVFLTDIPGDAVAAAKAKQICALMRKAYSAEVEISGSIGIAIVPRDGTDFNTLYKKADAALYHVKGSGKDNYAFYHDDMDDEHLSQAEQPSDSDCVIPQKKKRRMLIVDDSVIDYTLLSRLFVDEFIIEKARDGKSALIRLRHYGTAISVVLLDLVMPGMDGFAVLKEMQESAQLRNVPVIVVSGDEKRETSLRAIREGAVDFVNKPVDPEILRIRVHSAISKAENERLRAKNSFLEYQNSEIEKYKTALERTGAVVIENDVASGGFVYDASISEHIAGAYDERGLWQILLADGVADAQTIKKMQELVQKAAADREREVKTTLIQLKTPAGACFWFRMNVYKTLNELGLAEKIFIILLDMGPERT